MGVKSTRKYSADAGFREPGLIYHHMQDFTLGTFTNFSESSAALATQVNGAIHTSRSSFSLSYSIIKCR